MGKTPSIESTLVTPDVAAEWLGFNTENRTKKARQILALSAAITRGEWKMNGETIKFSGTKTNPKKLLDGQNRLHAIILAGKPVVLHVAWGVDETAQDTMDVGTKRTLHDALTLVGEKYSSGLASAITFMWRESRGLRGGSEAPTIPQARQILADHPGLRDSMAAVHRGNTLRYPPGLAAFLAYTFAEIDPADSEVFWYRLLTGTGLQEGDPIHLLRNVVAADGLKLPRMSKSKLWAITIKSWNAWRDGTEVKLLRFIPGGSHRETFPVAR